MARTSLDLGRIKWGVTCKALSMSLECKYSTNKYTVLHNHVCLPKPSHQLRRDPHRLVLPLCSHTEKEVEAIYSTRQSAAIMRGTTRAYQNYLNTYVWTKPMFGNQTDAQKIITNNVITMSKHTYPLEGTCWNTSLLKFCNRCVNRELSWSMAAFYMAVRKKQIQNDLKLVGGGLRWRFRPQWFKIIKIMYGPKMSKFCYCNKRSYIMDFKSGRGQ